MSWNLGTWTPFDARSAVLRQVQWRPDTIFPRDCRVITLASSSQNFAAGACEVETPLTRHNFAYQALRLWRTMRIAPMASNLDVYGYEQVMLCKFISSKSPEGCCPRKSLSPEILPSCADDGENDLLFLLNEKPLRIAGCQSNGLCKQSLITQRFSRCSDGDCMKLFSNGSESSKM